jgi:hypothetical protein
MEDILAENPGAKQLYEARKMLADKLYGPTVIGDEIQSSAKGAQVETRRMIDAIDARLNEASDDTWGYYLKTYRDMSKPLNNARALGEIKGDLSADSVPKIGMAPEVTNRRLQAAIDKNGTSPRYGNRLDAKATRELDQIGKHLQRTEEAQRSLVKAGTSGGGSNTAMDTVGQEAQGVALEATGRASGIPFAGAILSGAKRALDVRGQKELSDLLRDPQRAAAAIQLELRNQRPLTEAQQLFLTQAYRAPIAGVGALQSE